MHHNKPEIAEQIRAGILAGWTDERIAVMCGLTARSVRRIRDEQRICVTIDRSHRQLLRRARDLLDRLPYEAKRAVVTDLARSLDDGE